MKKRLSEEKTGLNQGLSTNKILLFIVLFYNYALPQISINSFCKLDHFKTDSGFSKIFSVNYNQDQYADLVMYNPSQKNVKRFEGEANLVFKETAQTFPFEPNSFEPVFNNLNQIDYYAVTSRKGRSLNLLKFNSSGQPEILDSYKFSSYPDFVDSDDIDGDGITELLVTGNSFDGISLLSFDGKIKLESAFEIGESFKAAQFIHLNNDDFKDFVAISSVKKSLSFFRNIGRNRFKEERTINLYDDVEKFQIFDINSDNFVDIVLSTSKFIQIYFGDSLSTFNKHLKIATNFKPDDFVIGDFNRDGNFDIIYGNFENGIISVLFAKSAGAFHQEMLYTQVKGLKEIIPFFSRFVYGVVYLSGNGTIGIISSLKSFINEVDILTLLKPAAITTFDNNSDGVIDIAGIDLFDKSLKFILRNAAGIPQTYFHVKLFAEHENIFILEKSKTEYLFYLYSIGKRLIEIVNIDFQNFKITKEQIYSPGNIYDLKANSGKYAKPDVYLLYSYNNELFYGIYSYPTVRFSFTKFRSIRGNWLEPKILSTSKNVVSYWLRSADNLTLHYTFFESGNIRSVEKYSISASQVDQVLSSQIDDGFESFVYTTALTGKGFFRIGYGGGDLRFLSIKDQNQKFRIKNGNQLFFGATNILYFHNPGNKKFYRLVLNQAYSKILAQELFNEIKLDKFIVEKLDFRNEHLISIKTNEPVINIRPIK